MERASLFPPLASFKIFCFPSDFSKLNMMYLEAFCLLFIIHPASHCLSFSGLWYSVFP